jgi:hypothetical protein
VVGVLLLCCCAPSCVGVIMNWGAIMAGFAVKETVIKKDAIIIKDDPFKDAFKDLKDIKKK